MIRKMLKKDLKRVLRIYGKAIEEGKSTFQAKCPTTKAWDKSHSKEFRFVFEENGCIKGFAVLSKTSVRECFDGVLELSIYIDQEYRHQGIGLILGRYIIDNAFENGIWCIFSSIFSDNIASISLHKELGFREIGYREKIAKDIFGKYLDVIYFELRKK